MQEKSVEEKVREKLSEMTIDDLERLSEEDLKAMELEISIQDWKQLIAELRRERIKNAMRLVAEAAFTKRDHPTIPEEHLVKEIQQASKKKGH